ncbi:MAG TPA: hypothetical protein VGB17_18535 [Pyrinomonadaceae bacterium]|jgi:hypothetical protein
MNCRKFEKIVNELAREQLMDAEAREEGLAHIETCQRCAARLSEERALTAGLRALSASEAGKEAPAHIETALLAAFRQGQGAAVKTAANANVIALPQRSARRWLYWAGAAAAAAAVLFVFALNISRVQPDNPQGTLASKATQPAPSVVQPSPERGANPGSNALEEIKDEDEPRAIEQHDERPEYHYASNSTPVPLPRASESAGRSLDPRPVGNIPAKATDAEITTDFMPLAYDTGALDSGHVVRVELPRSALVSMGLPMNMERANEPVKADVLMGDDGVARAIRFVR